MREGAVTQWFDAGHLDVLPTWLDAGLLQGQLEIHTERCLGTSNARQQLGPKRN